MRKTFRKLALSVAALSAILTLVAGLAWWSIHTAWFANLVRARLVSVIRGATGGRVELGSFSFNPDNLHARISRLIIHGTEPSGSPPLLAIESIDVGLKILSVWRQDVDVQSVVINRPRVFLLVNPDGTTNVPTPKHRNPKAPVEQLFDLKIKHLEVNDGLLQANKRELPFNFSSQGVGALLDYNYSGPSYSISLDADAVKFSIPSVVLHPMRVSAKARLFRNHADIASLKIITDKAASTIDLTGKVEHFAQPTLDAKVEASLSIDELAQMPDINQQLRHGRGSFSGSAHFDSSSDKFAFNGKARASGVDLILPGFVVRNMAANADMVANNDGMLLHHAEGTARGAHFSGEGSIKGYNLLEVAGRVSQIGLNEVGSYLTRQPFPWSGVAQGTAHASARLLEKNPNFIIGAKVQIDPAQSGIPTSGSVDVTYYNRAGRVEFGDSTLQLPHSSATFSGSLNNDLVLSAETSNLADLKPILPILNAPIDAAGLPELGSGDPAHFDGVLANLMQTPTINGNLTLNKFKFRGYDWDALTGKFTLSSNALSVSQFQLQQAGGTLAGGGSAQLTNWAVTHNSAVQLSARFNKLNIVKTAAMFTSANLPIIQGIASGNIALRGTLDEPHASGSLNVANLDAYGEQLNRIELDAKLEGSKLQISKGHVQSGPALLSFSGAYRHAPNDWNAGDLEVSADSNGFPLSGLSTIRKFAPALNARAELHFQAAGKLRLDASSADTFEPAKIDGGAQLSNISVDGHELGSATLKAATTKGSAIEFSYNGSLRDTKFHGAAQARLTAGTPIHGDLQIDRISLATLKALATSAPGSDAKFVLPVDGFLDGGVAFDGSLEDPKRVHARATIQDLQIGSQTSSPDLVLHNNEPILIDLADGDLNVTKFEMDGRDTSVKLAGRAPLRSDNIAQKPMDIKATGTADLALFALFDPSVKSSGNTELAANITGTLFSPNVSGAIKINNGSFFLSDLPNGLSDVNGTVVFSRNRATIQKMSAHSGGGNLSLGGSISFGAGTPLVYHLEAAARDVRVRYANSISVTANSDLRLSGTSASSILSGTLTVTRIVFTPNADAGNLLAAASSSTYAPADQTDFISGLHLDVMVESAPNLEVSTNLSRDVEAELQLRLRGTPDHPIVLGNITANQGDLKIFGTRFSLNRGEVSFVNTVRVEPVLDLDLETQARGVTVDITVSGTPSKLNFNYRSDPPLQPRDIIALLTVGRTPDVGTASNLQSGSDVGALTSGVNSVLGQAISPVSNRLSKLFGITNIKIDPFVQGITNTPQARLSVEQQISRNVTITYVTNLSQTSEQIFRFEWALNRQFSIVALRDDNGEFGIDFQYKKRFK